LSRSLSPEAIIVEVKKITSEPVKVVYDAVSLADTQKTAWSLLAPGGQLIIVLFPTEGIVSGQDGKTIAHVIGNVNYPGQEIGRELYARLSQLLKDGSIKVRPAPAIDRLVGPTLMCIQPNRVEVLPKGLEGIPDGLKLMQQDKVSGTKLVAHPQETA
jgi:threonine dehydrogenase-like Zn-dependent dehydrogenase